MYKYLRYEMPTYIQKGMIADDPKTPEWIKNRIYDEINFETNIEYRKIAMTKMLISDCLDAETKKFLWIDLKELLNKN